MIGPDLGHLRRDCTAVMDSHRNPDSGAFDDAEWLAGMYSPDGQTVHALVDDECHGTTIQEAVPTTGPTRSPGAGTTR